MATKPQNGNTEGKLPVNVIHGYFRAAIKKGACPERDELKPLAKLISNLQLEQAIEDRVLDPGADETEGKTRKAARAIQDAIDAIRDLIEAKDFSAEYSPGLEALAQVKPELAAAALPKQFDDALYLIEVMETFRKIHLGDVARRGRPTNSPWHRVAALLKDEVRNRLHAAGHSQVSVTKEEGPVAEITTKILAEFLGIVKSQATVAGIG